ncbi:MAG: SpoIIE family protein phosphatase [Planctomycetota bacterium]
MQNIREVAERGFGEILDFVNSGIYVTDTERHIVFWNRTAEQITGYTAEEVVGKRCSANIMGHTDKEGQRLCTSDLCPLHRAMQRGSRAREAVLVYVQAKDGRELPLLTSVAPVLDDDGQVIGGVEVFRDESERIREMELARNVQRHMLNPAPPTDERASFQVHYVPREMIGGDFYHLRSISDDLFGVLVGDASGHGIHAALYCSIIYGAVRESEDRMSSPSSLLEAVNRRACLLAAGLGFFTAFCAVLDAAGGTLSYCAAGHPPPLLQRADGEVDMLKGSGLPIGLQEEASYEDIAVQLEPGDRILVYTDGVTDVTVGQHERLGSRGLADLADDLPVQDGDHRLDRLYAALMDRCTTVQPEDDITLVSCLFSG